MELQYFSAFLKQRLLEPPERTMVESPGTIATGLLRERMMEDSRGIIAMDQVRARMMVVDPGMEATGRVHGPMMREDLGITMMDQALVLMTKEGLGIIAMGQVHELMTVEKAGITLHENCSIMMVFIWMATKMGKKQGEKAVKAKLLYRFKKLIKKPKLVFISLVGAATLIGGSYSLITIQKKSHTEHLKNERANALLAVESTLKLSKTIKDLYDSGDDRNKLIQVQGKFSMISDQLLSLNNAKTGNRFIGIVRKASEFFNSYCKHQVDLLNKTEAMKLDLSINNHVDTDKIEKLLSEKSKYGAQANQMQNEVLQAIPKAFAEWEKVLSPEDCHMIFGYIDESFEAEKKKLSDRKEKKGEPELYLHEWIAMQINEEVFNRWMGKELGDLLSEYSSSSPKEQEIDDE